MTQRDPNRDDAGGHGPGTVLQRFREPKGKAGVGFVVGLAVVKGLAGGFGAEMAKKTLPEQPFARIREYAEHQLGGLEQKFGLDDEAQAAYRDSGIGGFEDLTLDQHVEVFKALPPQELRMLAEYRGLPHVSNIEVLPTLLANSTYYEVTGRKMAQRVRHPVSTARQVTTARTGTVGRAGDNTETSEDKSPPRPPRRSKPKRRRRSRR